MSRALERLTGRRYPLRGCPRTRILRIVAGGLPGGTWQVHALGRGAVLQVALDLEASARRLWPRVPVDRHSGDTADREAWAACHDDRARAM